MLTLTSWRTPATDYPDAELGNVRIETVKYRRGYYRCYGLREHQVYRVAKPITIRGLTIDGKTWMVDDPPHWWAMEEHAQFYRGHVLVAGLGLGLIVHTLAANPNVSKITVVEREKDVIDLVSPYIPAVEIEYGDFWEWDGPTPDGVFFDLLVGNGRELVPDALRAYVQMFQWFPGATIRIHGFNNNWFRRLPLADRRGRCTDRATDA
jgi:hypothetical protein